MTSQEATLWVAAGSFVIALLFGMIGAAGDEHKNKQMEAIGMGGMGIFGMMCFGALFKWVLALFIN